MDKRFDYVVKNVKCKNVFLQLYYFVYCDGLLLAVHCLLTLTTVLHALICLKNQKFGEHGLKTRI